MRQLRRSRAVEEAGYEAGTRTLRIRFRNGGLYDYFDVPSDVYTGLIGDAHPWTRFGQHIRRTYRHRRLE